MTEECVRLYWQMAQDAWTFLVGAKWQSGVPTTCPAVCCPSWATNGSCGAVTSRLWGCFCEWSSIIVICYTNTLPPWPILCTRLFLYHSFSNPSPPFSISLYCYLPLFYPLFFFPNLFVLSISGGDSAFSVLPEWVSILQLKSDPGGRQMHRGSVVLWNVRWPHLHTSGPEMSLWSLHHLSTGFHHPLEIWKTRKLVESQFSRLIDNEALCVKKKHRLIRIDQK